MKKSIRTPNASPPGGPYAHAVTASGRLAFLAGCTPHMTDGELVTGSFEEQARRAFDNLAAVAEAAGGSLDQAVRVGVYLEDMGDFAEMNALFEHYFGTDAPPVRTTLPVPGLAFAIEVDAILALD